MKRVKKNFNYKSEKGQAIVLLALLLTAIVGVAALAIDGGRLYYERRRAQNAVDNAALAGAWAVCVNHFDPLSAAFGVAELNGYDNDNISNIVRVYNPPSQGNHIGDEEYVEVLITSNISAAFSQVVFSGPLQSSARAVAFCDTGQTALPVMFAGSTTCQNSIQWSGANGHVIGTLHSNHDVLISGASNLIEGTLSYVTTIDGQEDKITYYPAPPANPQQTYPRSYPVNFESADFAPGGSGAIAAQNDGNRYYYCDCDINISWLSGQGLYDNSTHLLEDGLYYSTEDIWINAGIIGNSVTFVAEGEISLNGANQILRPYTDYLLAFSEKEMDSSSICSSAIITFSGSQSDWGGIIFAPNGLVEMSGASTENSDYWGSIIADSIRLSGASIELQYDPNLFENLPPKVSLAE